MRPTPRALLLAAALLLPPGRLPAAEYECFIDVEGPDDLQALRAEGRISEGTLRALLPLLDAPVDPARAAPEVLHRLPNLTRGQVEALLRRRRRGAGRVALEALVSDSVVSPRVAASLAPFLAPPAAREGPDGGWQARVRLRAGLLWADGLPPAAALDLRARAPSGWGAEAAVALTRLRPGAVGGGPSGWTVAPPAPRPQLTQATAHGAWGAASVVVGSYRVGYGRGLTFDTTGRPAPDGAEPEGAPERHLDPVKACRGAGLAGAASPCAGAARFARAAADFSWREGLRGLAVDGIPLGRVAGARLALSAWASHQRRDLYQYQVLDRSTCPDAGAGCPAPTIRVDPAERPWALAYSTLPDAFDEVLAGLRLSLVHGERLAVGATAWAGRLAWRLPGTPGFQPWAPWPAGAGWIGAVGLDASATQDWGRLWGEVAAVPGARGAAAGLVGVTGGGRGHHLEASLRLYGRGWANPHGSPPAAPDRAEGFAARDEAGARLAWSGRWRGWRLRARGDLWGRADASAPSGVGAVSLGRSLPRLGEGTLEAAFGGDLVACPPDAAASGTPGPCDGAPRLRLAVGWTVAPTDRSRVRLRASESSARDRTAALLASLRPIEAVRLRGRLRWFDASPGDPARGETSLTAGLEADVRRGRWSLALRADLRMGLDARPSTTLRTPAPEVRLFLTVEATAGG